MNNEFSFVDNIPFSIAAGESLPLPAGSWDYLYMAELSGGDLLAEGAALRLPFILGRQIRVSKKETGTILLTNRGSTTATGVIYAGSGDVEDMALVGTVRVSNLQKSREQTDTGNQMLGSGRHSGTSAQYSYAQLFNPSGSGVIAYVQKIIMSTDDSRCSLMKYDTEIGTVQTSFGAHNNKSRAYEPVVKIRGGASASILGDQISLLRMLANTPIEWLGESPIKLLPGEGIHVRSGGTNRDLQAHFEWEEIDE